LRSMTPQPPQPTEALTLETDAEAYDVGDYGKEPRSDGDHVSSGFARQLERDRDQLRARVAELEKELYESKRISRDRFDSLMAAYQQRDDAQDKLKAAREDTERINAMADERIVDGLGDTDIDEATSDSLLARDPNYDGNDADWKLEWRNQFRIAVDKTFRSAALKGGML